MKIAGQIPVEEPQPATEAGYESTESHSDDEEWNQRHIIPRDEHHYHFYDYAITSIMDTLHSLQHSIGESLHGLTDSYHDLKKEYKDTHKLTDTKRAKKHQVTNMFDIKEFQKTSELQKSNTKNNKISRFRPNEGKWDGSFTPDPRLMEQLYRTPCRDPTGKVFFSLGRDEAKGVKPWKPPQTDQDLPEPSFASCAESFQRQVLAHMDATIEKVEAEYAKMVETTQDKSALKARVGRDLNNLKRKRDKLRAELEEIDKARKA